jgi:bifunctional non-homologous end joining protein LigD
MPANSGSGGRGGKGQPPEGKRPVGPLDRYRSMRDAGRTPEPFGSAEASLPAAAPGHGTARFVVQKHAARRLHYDFRLELGGVLLSWAVPRGPCLDPAEKRMAVMVENHPIEYADFEGIIPEGNYGAGPVIVWDRGTWCPVEDPVAGLDSGKLLFDLMGHKLRGRWTLVRTKGSAAARARARDASGERAADGAGAGEWLLIKKPDGYSDPDGSRTPPEYSVLSGRELEAVRDGTSAGDDVSRALESAGAPLRRVDPSSLRPMLCETRDQAFDRAGWLFEIKLDGYRLLAGIDGGQPFLRYRRGLDATAIYPEIALALRSMPYQQLVLDGEVVCFDPSGRPDFGRLQTRAMLSRARDSARAALTTPAHLMAFDLLGFEGRDARDLPLARRKELLRQLVADVGVIRYVDHIEQRGADVFASVQELGLEGVVGKKADSRYRSGRFSDWVKVRCERTDEFAVVGYTPPSGTSRIGFSGLHLAVRDRNRWIYAGKVGGGFRDAELARIREALDRAPRAEYDFEAEAALDPSRWRRQAPKESVWVEPNQVVTVRYKEWQPPGRLRQPTFLRLRDDIAPEDCRLPRSTGSGDDEPALAAEDAASAAPAAPPASAERTINLTNLGKVFWPAEGYSKGDLLDYYREVSPWLLPYLADRPLVLTRYPDGIDGKSFYQKDAPTWSPAWVRTESVWSESSEREIHYFVCDDLDSLLYVVNLGTIPLHIWSSRVSDLARPDWCILDLDPKGAPFSDVIACALAIRRLADELELETFVKTSGSTGLHVLVPLGRQLTYEQSRTLAGLVVRIIEAEQPELATTARVIDHRQGKVYLDWLQNRHGQLLVAPLSVRPLAGAPVSMPLRWSEVNRRLDHSRFTIANARRRLERLGEDPVKPVLTRVPDLLGALERLDERMRRAGAHPEPPVGPRSRKVR